MGRRFTLPFRTARPEHVLLGAWHWEREPGLVLRVEESIPGWDYLMPLRLQREVSVRAALMRQHCGLPAETEIILTVTAHAPQSRYRALQFRSAPLAADEEISSVGIQIDATQLAGDLLLDTEVLLAAGSRTSVPFVARLPGSRLFTERTAVRLEGSASRLPMEAAAFTTQLGWLAAPRAPWYVSCEAADLGAPVGRALRVYLNSEEPAFLEAAGRSDPLVITLLGAETARRVLLAALDDADFINQPHDYAEGSLGQTASRLLSVCFPSRRPRDVRTLVQEDGARFDAAIQSFMNAGPRHA